MKAADLLRAGKLGEAQQLLVRQVKQQPSDLGLRTLLARVLSFGGDWSKAEQQLDVIAAIDSARETGVQVMKNLLQAERKREQVFAGEQRPEFLPEAPTYAENYFLAQEKILSGQPGQARILLQEIDCGRFVAGGTCNGRAFKGFRDTDSLLAFFLEAMVYEKYVWVPFESILELEVSRPGNLSDLIWAPAQVTCRNGLVLHCFLPVRYPGSSGHTDERVKLGRMTDWVSLSGTLTRAFGQHVYQVGAEEVALLELTDLQFTREDTT